jgi:MoxR-like ATPase
MTTTSSSTALAAWLQAFPASEVEKQLKELQEKRAQLDQQIETLQTALDTFRHLDQPLVPAAGAEGVPLPRRLSKRVVALRFLSEHPDQEFSPADIRDALMERGEMGRSDNEYHALRVALQKAFKDEQVNRPSTGRYRHLAQGFEEPG